jgi:hypothetical protein
MIIVKLKGGLGNQLFQYAYGRKLSIQAETELKLDIGASPELFQKNAARSYRLDRFNIQAEIATLQEVEKLKYPMGLISRCVRAFEFRILNKHNIDFDRKCLKKKNNVYKDGFWQSEKYFADIRPALLSELTLAQPLSGDAQRAKVAIDESAGAVSLHVRRGDYISDPGTNRWHGNIATPEYYAKAVAFMSERVANMELFIFSDDIGWVKKNIPLPSSAVFVSTPAIADYEELVLMGLCRHHIIANSSFSWWGAWLNPRKDKIVIAPSRWTNKIPDPHKNIIPPTWTRL